MGTSVCDQTVGGKKFEEDSILCGCVSILLYYYVDEPFFNIFFTYYVTSLQDQIV